MEKKLLFPLPYLLVHFPFPPKITLVNMHSPLSLSHFHCSGKNRLPLSANFQLHHNPIATFQKIEKSTIKDKSQWHETCVSLVMLQVIAFLTPMFIRLGTWGIGDWILSAVSWCCGVQFHGFSTCSFCLHVKH